MNLEIKIHSNKYYEYDLCINRENKIVLKIIKQKIKSVSQNGYC